MNRAGLFQLAVFAYTLAAARAGDTAAIDAVLRRAVDSGDVAGVVAMVASPDKIVYHAALGKRDVGAAVAMTGDSIFRIYSMTKPVTSVAVMQLIEQGKVSLDDPAGKYLPAFAHPQILLGFRKGEPRFQPASRVVTVRQLLTHTSGLAYPFLDRNLQEYEKREPKSGGPAVLVFEPGERWQYGTSTDEAGKLVEAVSGLTLEQYFQQHIFDPLGMKETYFNVPQAEQSRIVSIQQRQADGTLKENARQSPQAVHTFSGGGGLYSTAADYVKFMQMVLHRGSGRARVLQSKTVSMMTSNQIGGLDAGRLETADPVRFRDADFHPGFHDRFGFGFLINPEAYAGGRSRGSLAWAGAANTFFWIDPERKLCAVILTQIFPFFDEKAVALLRSFEKAVYAH
jgi:CubicO group peptidase (beta-lactamase class C family)